MRKKFMAVVLAAALACNMTGVSAAAQPAAAGISLRSVFKGLFAGSSSDESEQTDAEESVSADETEGSQEAASETPAQGATSSPKSADTVTLDIGQGDIIISKNGISAVDTAGNPVTETSSQYIVTGYSEEHSIEVADGTNANITLSDVTIIRTAAGESPFWIADNSRGNVRVTLQGNNTLQAGEGAAAIQKNCTHNGSDGSCGRLEINCGNTESGHICGTGCPTLNATGSGGAAAIGGAAGTGSSDISIKGGIITATGGIGGASGGVGTNVDILGGVVIAGSINGKAGSDSNLMNGDTLLFADVTTNMELTKGILYQNNVGMVYGSVKVSQGMADYLPAGVTLTIPDNASLTIDEGTVLPNAENIDGEVTVKASKKPTATPTEEPTPTVTEEAPVIEEVMQAEANARDGEVYDGTMQVTLLDAATNTIVTNPEYGSMILIQAEITFNNTVSVNKPAGNGENVTFYVNNTNVQSKTLTVDDAGARGVAISDPITLTGSHITGLSAAGDTGFRAVYSGSSSHPSIEHTETRQLTKGNLSASYTEEGPIAAGQTVAGGLALPRNFLPVNGAGETVEGTWSWVDGDKRLWPGSTTTYYCDFTPTDATNYNSYTLERTPNVNIARISASANANLVLTTQSGQGPNDDGWYNKSHGEITASLSGYRFFYKEVGAVISTNEWETESNWLTSKEVYIGDTGYCNKQYEMYVRNNEDQTIGLAYIESLKVDQNLPVMDQVTDKYIEWDIGGSEIYPTIRCTQEGRESGLSIIYCAVKPRLDQGSVVAELTYDQVKQQGQRYPRSGTETFTQAMFSFDSLSSRSWYDMYVIICDNAGNETRYIHRIVDDSGNAISDAAEAGAYPDEANAEDGEFYGYAVQTDYQNFKGEVNMVVTAPDGTVRTDNTVTWGDTIRADVTTNMGNYGSRFIYAWYRVPKGSTTRQVIGGEIQSTYVPTANDIDCQIICTARGDLTSSHSPAEGEVGPVLRQPCPENYIPANCTVDDIQNIFSFTGYNGITYEYRTDGGRGDDSEWRTITGDGSGRFEIYVGDVTIKAGDLLVRSSQTDNYLPSDPVANEDPFISTAEFEVTITGEEQYGETLIAGTNSTAIDSSQISYEWSYSDGTRIDNVGNSYDLTKADYGKIIQVKAVVADFPNVDNTATTGRIGKRKVTAVVNVPPKQYDGTTTADATVEINGLINGDDLTGSAVVEFEDKNVGEEKKIKISSQRTTGADADYYTVSWDTDDTTGTIQPRQLTLNMTAENKVYDGTTDAEVSFSAQALPGDSIGVSGTGEFSDKNVGNNKTVTSKDVEVTGSDAANYTAAGSTATATANITPKDIELEGITVADKEYDNTTDAVIEANFKGAVDEVSYTYTASFENPNVGKDKRVTATITLTGDSAKNYNLANNTVTGTGNIVKALAPYEESDMPQGLTGVEGKKLSSVYIGKGFTWKDPSTVMETVGKQTYPAIYNPDPNQYGDREVELEVLVQCANHTWGEWTITVEPTKDEMGERQRICSVCGYTEVEVIPRAPYIANDDTKVGWGDIIQAINNASSGTEIPVIMNGTETLPASVQDALQGRPVSLVLQMDDGITWTIRGEDITGTNLKDINMAVSLYTDNIPSDVIDPYAKGKTAIQIHLAYSGEFGFVATLRVPLSNEFAGIDSTLYYYNPTRERLEQMDKNKITEDGIGRYDFTHASDYVAIIDKASSDVQGGDTPSGNASPTPAGTNSTVGATGATGGAVGLTPSATGQATGTTSGTTSTNTSSTSSNGAKTEDETPIMIYLFLFMVSAVGITAIGVYRRNKRIRR